MLPKPKRLILVGVSVVVAVCLVFLGIFYQTAQSPLSTSPAITSLSSPANKTPVSNRTLNALKEPTATLIFGVPRQIVVGLLVAAVAIALVVAVSVMLAFNKNKVQEETVLVPVSPEETSIFSWQKIAFVGTVCVVLVILIVLGIVKFNLKAREEVVDPPRFFPVDPLKHLNSNYTDPTILDYLKYFKTFARAVSSIGTFKKVFLIKLSNSLKLIDTTHENSINVPDVDATTALTDISNNHEAIKYYALKEVVYPDAFNMQPTGIEVIRNFKQVLHIVWTCIERAMNMAASLVCNYKKDSKVASGDGLVNVQIQGPQFPVRSHSVEIANFLPTLYSLEVPDNPLWIPKFSRPITEIETVHTFLREVNVEMVFFPQRSTVQEVCEFLLIYLALEKFMQSYKEKMKLLGN